MSQIHRMFICFFVAVLALADPSLALGQHSDVEFIYDNGKIDIEFGPEGQVYEGDFPTSGTDMQFTSEPGFGSETDEMLGIEPNDVIVYNVLDNLLFWDGSAIVAPAADTSIRVGNRPPTVPDTIITGTSGPQPGSFSSPFNNRIGAAAADGDFHSDLDWFLESTSGTPATGAYAVKLSLSTDEPGIADSNPFFVVFNFGLEEDLSRPGPHFEEAVEAFASLIPEPTSLALFGTATVVLGLARRRQS